MIHGKFLKINQELHRIQQVYQDLRHQYPNDDVEPVRTFKKQMEKGRCTFIFWTDMPKQMVQNQIRLFLEVEQIALRGAV